MSWLENIDSDIIIICGDGRRYVPAWMRSTVEQDYNVADYEFLEVSGTLMRKYQPKGARYEIRICFQGENHLDEVANFMKSAADKRPWTIQHPLYGTLKVQPMRLKRDDTSINVTEISGPFVETITEESPRTEVSKPFKVLGTKQSLDDIVGDQYVLGLSPSAIVINPLVKPTQVVSVQRRNISQIYNNVSKKVKGWNNLAINVVDAQNYLNLFHAANSAVLQMTSAPLVAARAVIDLLNAPFQFKNSVQSRVNSLVAAFDMVRLSIEGLSDTASDVLVKKRVYESNGVMVISAMASASVLQLDQTNNELTDSPTVDGQNFTTPDYPSRVEVVAIMETLMAQYNTFVEDLDSLQTDNGGEEDSFIPDPKMARELSALIKFTIAELMDIVLTGRQERVITLEEDTDVISLTHRLYGLDDNDVALNQLIETNKIGINELLKLSKGRNIVYYV